MGIKHDFAADLAMLDVCLEMLQSHDLFVRRTACQKLGHLDFPTCHRALAAIAVNDGEEAVREVAQTTLRGREESVPPAAPHLQAAASVREVLPALGGAVELVKTP